MKQATRLTERQTLARARQLLGARVEPGWQRLHDKRCKALLKRLQSYLHDHPFSPHLVAEGTYFADVMIDFLRHTVESALNRSAQLHHGKRQFDARLGRAASNTERNALLLDYARELGTPARQLRRDRRALGRWFGADALQDRWLGLVAQSEQAADFALQRLGAITAAELTATPPPQREERWQRVRYDELCEPLFDGSVDERLVLTALRALNASITAMPALAAVHLVSQACQQFIYRLALDPEEPTGLQCEALRLMPRTAPAALVQTLTYRFEQAVDGNDMFVRARGVEVWCQALAAEPELFNLAGTIAKDGSALVRQRLAKVLPEIHARHRDGVSELLSLLSRDTEPAVRAQTLLTLEQFISGSASRSRAQQVLHTALANETDEFVYRVALRVWVATARLPHADVGDKPDPLLSLVNGRHQTDPSLRVRRWSAQAREAYVCRRHEPFRNVMEGISKQIAAGNRELDLSSLPTDASRNVIMRVLATLTQQNWGLEASFDKTDKARLHRLFKFGFRWWRWWYELRHPSTAKRQGHRHTIGRHFISSERAPSAILAEVAQTNVPGEPLNMPDEDGWRPYLPLVDECLSALQQERNIEIHRIHTSEGVTEIAPPTTLTGQLRAWWRLTRNFEHFAAWRNWRDGDQIPASHYVEQLAEMGICIRFTPHVCPDSGQSNADPAVTRFFAGLAPVSLVPGMWIEFKRHITSAYENTVFELASYVAVIAVLFFGRHIVLAALLRRARKRIPLVIGGWGTRGKSGTERLKAAMFNALGLSVFSKTTGCEAMFVMNRPFQPLRELFLFRPYDKATIWEQFNMVRLASRLDCDVFLWECMGLTPSYVRVLQQDWMRDDISTITNAFPDHEDLQGPAGIDIPQVMCEFIPVNGCLVTSEEKMLPVLASDAADKDTELHAVTWLEAGLLTPDVLARFPYEEHPYNIALVLGIADQLGIENDFALKEMADQVVMDLGVLKTYPTATVGDRRLEFIMGMSANERFGALNNWTRMEMDKTAVSTHPEIWVSTLVNNRADRVARSRVFADLLVQDISADQHVLIGTNLKGLRGYLEESWHTHMQNFSLWPEDAAKSQARETLLARTRTLRAPVTLEELRGRLQALATAELPAAVALDGLWGEFSKHADSDTLEWGTRWRDQFIGFLDLQNQLEQLSAPDLEFEQRVRAQLWQWFAQKLLVVADTHISGDELAAYIVANSPPRLCNRIMGMQNIKGTGLDFVYAWQTWEEQCALARQLADEDDSVFAHALGRLANQPQIGLLGRNTLTAALEEARHNRAAQRESAQAQITALLAGIDESESGATTTQRTMVPRSTPSRAQRWLDKLVNALEAFFDAGDAVRRRRVADRVYKDLVTSRISEDRAIAEIKAINSRQKGGWLRQRLSGLIT